MRVPVTPGGGVRADRVRMEDMRGLRRALILGALLACAAPAWARPVNPNSGGFEVGGSFFVTSQTVEDSSLRDVVAGPQLHLAVRLPVSENLMLGFMGRLGASLGKKTGSTSLIALDGRLVFGNLDLAPYLSLGFGVLFRSVLDNDDLTELVQRPDAAMPVGLGIETRLADELMLGFSARYTAILSDLGNTTGPIDAAIYLVFL